MALRKGSVNTVLNVFKKRLKRWILCPLLVVAEQHCSEKFSHPNETQREIIMICNVFGKAVTKSTALNLLEYKNSYESDISCVDLARVALALKNSQGKGEDEEEALRSVKILRDECGREEGGFCTLGYSPRHPQWTR